MASADQFGSVMNKAIQASQAKRAITGLRRVFPTRRPTFRGDDVAKKMQAQSLNKFRQAKTGAPDRATGVLYRPLLSAASSLMKGAGKKPSRGPGSGRAYTKI